MEYLVFPFGKYKGTKLEDLPSTYIVLALEKFELPDELHYELTLIIYGRLKVFSFVLDNLVFTNVDERIENISFYKSKYESHE